MSSTPTIDRAMRPRARHRAPCALLAAALCAIAPSSLAAVDEHADAAGKSWAQQASLPSRAGFDFGNEAPTHLARGHAWGYWATAEVADARPTALDLGRSVADLTQQPGIDTVASPAPESASYALMLVGLVAVGCFMWNRRRDLN